MRKCHDVARQSSSGNFRRQLPVASQLELPNPSHSGNAEAWTRRRHCAAQMRPSRRAVSVVGTPPVGQGSSRRPRRRGPSAPRRHDPHCQPAAPSQGERESTPVGAGSPQRTCSQSLLHSRARAPGGTPGGLITSPAVLPHSRPGPRAVRRPACGRTGWVTCGGEKEKEKNASIRGRRTRMLMTQREGENRR